MRNERDSIKHKMGAFKADMDNFDKIVRQRVFKALQTNQLDLQAKVKEQ